MLWLFAMILGSGCLRSREAGPEVAGSVAGRRPAASASSGGGFLPEAAGSAGGAAGTGGRVEAGWQASVFERKAYIRKEMQRIRIRFSGKLAAECSRKICARVLDMPEVQRAGYLALYAALPGEVNLESVIKEWERKQKEVLLPRRRADGGYEMVAVRDFAGETVPGALGILEPRPDLPSLSRRGISSASVTWLVPGVAFDESGVRLGRGKGIYDRLLSGTGGPRVGVAFEWQIVPRLPFAPHDVRMDALASECRIRRFPR